MLKLASIALFAIALVATNAVRKSSVDIKMEIGDGEEDIQIHRFNNFEENYSIHNDDQTMPVNSIDMNESNVIENNDQLFLSDSSGIDNSDLGGIRLYQFGDIRQGKRFAHLEKGSIPLSKTPRDIRFNITYPGRSVTPFNISYVFLLVNQSSDIGSAKIVEGGIGQQSLVILVESIKSLYCNFTALYSRK